MASSGGSSDLLVVSTRELQRALLRFLDEFDALYDDLWVKNHKDAYERSARREGLRHQPVWHDHPGSEFLQEQLRERFGWESPARVLFRIRRLETKFTNLSIADPILTVMRMEHLLNTEIRVVANPNISQERWLERMAEIGCEPRDFS